MNEKIKSQVFILILGVLIGASVSLANSLFLWNTSVNKDKNDIAEGLYLDISSLEDYLVAVDQGFVNSPNGTYVFVQATPLYPDNGLYFTYQGDLPKMDRKVAQDTFMFYHHLLSAERDRSLIYEIQREGDTRELTASERNRQHDLTVDVAREVNISVSLLPSLKKELSAAT